MRQILFCFLCVAFLTGNVSQAQILTTVAGNNTVGFYGDGMSADNAVLKAPEGMAIDRTGNIYFADRGNNRIRKIDTAGIITTVAGNGTAAVTVSDGIATDVSLNNPCAVATDNEGNIYVAEYGGNRIRKVDVASGVMTTIAGSKNGYVGYNGESIPATSALLNRPTGVAVNRNGEVLIAEIGSFRIRKINNSGVIKTIAGDGVYSFSAWSIATDSAGNIYYSDLANSRIRKINSAGITTTVAGNGTFGYAGDGGPADSAEIYNAENIAVDNAGNLYLSDLDNHRIRRVDTAGIITTVAGDGVPGYNGDGINATAAELYQPNGVVVDASGAIYISDQGNNRIRVVRSQLAVARQNDPRTISVYPNPVNDVFYVGPSGNLISNIAIFDIGGREITRLQPDGKQSVIPVSLAGALPGLYFISMQTSKGLVTRTITKR